MQVRMCGRNEAHLQFKRQCAVQTRYIISTNEDPSAVQVGHIISINESVKYISSVRMKMSSTSEAHHQVFEKGALLKDIFE